MWKKWISGLLIAGMLLPAWPTYATADHPQESAVTSTALQANPNIALSPSHLLVKTRGGVATPKNRSIQNVNEFLGLRIAKLENLSSPRRTAQTFAANTEETLWLLTLAEPGEAAVIRAIEQLRTNPDVVYAEPDYIYQTDAMLPDDPGYTSLYGMEKIGAPGAWEISTGSDRVKVGVIDTGIDVSHPDLSQNLWTNPGEIPDNGIDDDGNGYIDDIHGWNFVDNTNDIADGHGHGTHVSGTIGAVGNNGEGVSGVCWTVSLVGLKALGDDGTGITSNFIKAIYYAGENGIEITNNSYGGAGYSRAFREAIESYSGLVVAASGNERMDNDLYPHYPSDYDLSNILSVGATDENDQIAYFSNTGRTSVDLFAPGMRIYSCLPGGGYGGMSGTSMASPHAAGAAALLLSKEPELTGNLLKSRLMESAEYLPQLSGYAVTGGRLDASAALQGAAGPALQGLSLEETQLQLAPGDVVPLTPACSPADAGDKRIVYRSSAPYVAEVDRFGILRAKAAGTAEIVVSAAEDAAVSASLLVTVDGAGTEIAIPDTALKTAVMSTLQSLPLRDGDTSGLYSGYTVESSLYAADLYRIAVLSAKGQGICDATGLEQMPNLRVLDVTNNALPTLEVSHLSLLHTLRCADNRLVSLALNPQNYWMELALQYNYLDTSAGSAFQTLIDALKPNAEKLRYLPQNALQNAETISVSCETAQMKLRETQLLRASVLPDGAYEQELLWKSDNTAVATVSDFGVVTATGPGTARITVSVAENSSLSAEALIQVSNETISPIAFQDPAFQREIVAALNEQSAGGFIYTEGDALYPDDLLNLYSLTVDDPAVWCMDEIKHCYGLINLTISQSDRLLALDLRSLVRLYNLSIVDCGIKALDLRELDRLSAVRVSDTKLSQLKLTGCVSLDWLEVPANNLYTLDLSGLSRLTTLFCQGNFLTLLDLSQNGELTTLNCSNNRLIRLDASTLAFLDTLQCENNRLKTLLLSALAPYQSILCAENYLDLSDGTHVQTMLQRARKAGAYVSSDPQYSIAEQIDSLSPAYMHLENGENGALSVTPVKGMVQFASSDPSVATVDENGIVTPVSPGYAVIHPVVNGTPESDIQTEVYVTQREINGDGSAAYPFLLRSDDEFKFIFRFTTLGDNNTRSNQMRYLRANYRLETDVTQVNEELVPIGYRIFNGGDSGFQGVFDGAGHSITNLHIRATAGNYLPTPSYPEEGIGMFAYLNGGTVKNVTLGNLGADNASFGVTVDAIKACTSGYGSLAGYAENAVLQSVWAKAFVSCGGRLSNVGGLLGCGVGVQILDCQVDAAVTVLSGAAEEVTGTAFGGLVGSLEQGSVVRGCTISGRVETGGVTGGLAGSISDAQVVDCVADTAVSGTACAGGFAGRITGDATIAHCAASGNVKAEDHVGGFAGEVSGGACITSSIAVGNLWGQSRVGGMIGSLTPDAGTITQCCAIGNLTGTDQRGGFVGFVGGGQMESVLATGAVLGSGSGGGLCGMREEPALLSSCFRYSGQVLENTTNSEGTSAELSLLQQTEFWESLLGQALDLEDVAQGRYPSLNKSEENAVLFDPNTTLGQQRTTGIALHIPEGTFVPNSSDVGGEILDLQAFVETFPESPMKRELIWSSDNPAVLTVQADGTASGLAFGKANVGVCVAEDPELCAGPAPIYVQAAAGGCDTFVELKIDTEKAANVALVESNQDSAAVPLILLAGMYDASGAFLRYELCVQSAGSPGDRVTSYTLSPGALEGAAVVKLFQWDSLAEMTPQKTVQAYFIAPDGSLQKH